MGLVALQEPQTHTVFIYSHSNMHPEQSRCVERDPGGAKDAFAIFETFA